MCLYCNEEIKVVVPIMNTYILKNSNIQFPILIEIVDKNPLEMDERFKKSVNDFVEPILNNIISLENDKSCWHSLTFNNFSSTVFNEINISRIDFKDKYRFYLDTAEVQNKLENEIQKLKDTLTKTIVDSILFVEDDICTEFGGDGIIINSDINNVIPYFGFEDYLSQKLNYDFTYLKTKLY